MDKKREAYPLHTVKDRTQELARRMRARAHLKYQALCDVMKTGRVIPTTPSLLQGAFFTYPRVAKLLTCYLSYLRTRIPTVALRR